MMSVSAGHCLAVAAELQQGHDKCPGPGRCHTASVQGRIGGGVIPAADFARAGGLSWVHEGVWGVWRE
jgi:hypothetical protein